MCKDAVLHTDCGLFVDLNLRTAWREHGDFKWHGTHSNEWHPFTDEKEEKDEEKEEEQPRKRMTTNKFTAE